MTVFKKINDTEGKFLGNIVYIDCSNELHISNSHTFLKWLGLNADNNFFNTQNWDAGYTKRLGMLRGWYFMTYLKKNSEEKKLA